jgi:SAM-dependent methyltransferase
MHETVGYFIRQVKALHPQALKDCRVLEVGSRYINGTVRTFFERCNYTGLDLAPGPLVDEVCHVADFAMGSENSCDTVVSCEALEHDSRWKESLRAMADLLRPGGLLVITCAGPGRPEHGTHKSDPTSSPATLDYYRNVDENMFWSAIKKTDFSDWRIKVADGDLQFWGIRG